MTMLTQIRGSFEPAPSRSVDRSTHAAHRADAYLAMIKRLVRFALPVLLAGGVLVGIVALRTAVYLWRLHS